MSGELLYLDSSALVKLVLAEKESTALVERFASWPVRVSSELARVEVLRAVRRVSTDLAVEQRAREVIAGLHLLRIDDDVLDQAALLEPRTLRSHDALHLASALSLGRDLAAMAVYDSALAAAASACGVEVVAPGLRT